MIAYFVMPSQNSFTVPLTPAQQSALRELLQTGNYRPVATPHTVIAVEGDNVRVALYTSGKCLVQGAGAADFMQFILEPQVLG